MNSRREFLKAAAVASATYPAIAARARNRPNIVILLADDLGYGDVACYNPESKIPTPNIDRMAKEGVRFVDAQTPCGVCSPTRYGLLTGRYPWRSELKSQVLWPWDKPLIEKERLTMPKMLKSMGYKTACFGKWRLGWDWATTDGGKVNSQVRIGDPQREIRYEFAKKVQFDKPVGEGPVTRGFDYYFGVDLPNFPPYTFIENDRLLAQPTEQKPDGMFGWPGAMAPGWRLESVLPEITKRAVGWMKDQLKQGDPFFLYFPLTAPHTPIAPDTEYEGKSKAGKYGDFVFQVDWCVGQGDGCLARIRRVERYDRALHQRQWAGKYHLSADQSIRTRQPRASAWGQAHVVGGRSSSSVRCLGAGPRAGRANGKRDHLSDRYDGFGGGYHWVQVGQ